MFRVLSLVQDKLRLHTLFYQIFLLFIIVGSYSLGLLRIFLSLFLLSCLVYGEKNQHIDHFTGNITITELFESYKEFEKSYDNYIPANFGEISIEGLNVKIFFGTWCHDSKRELPRLLKIFKQIGIEDANIELIAVGTNKKEPQGRATKLNLVYTPTLIFFRGSQEIGRIIEKPVISLEKDIALIISPI